MRRSPRAPAPRAPSVLPAALVLVMAAAGCSSEGEAMPGAEQRQVSTCFFGGAEIRAEGRMRYDGVLEAERGKVLCRAPVAMRKDEIPPEAEPVHPEAMED